jgi:hypothetical protein
MAIEFRCSNCGKLLRVGDDSAGKRAKCPGCATVLPIPAAGSVAPAAAPAGAPAPPSPARAPSNPNPYQSPRAASPAAAPFSPRPAAGAAAPGAVEFGTILGKTWDILKNRLGFCILVALLPGLVIGGIEIVGFSLVGVVGAALRSAAVILVLYFLLMIAIMAVACWLGISQIRMYFKVARGQEATIGELFVFDSRVVPAFLTLLLFSIMVNIGYFLFIVPGFFVLAMFFPCVGLALDRDVGVMESFSQASKMTEGNRMGIFLTCFLGGLIAMLGTLLTCGIGALIAAPFMGLMFVVIYLTLAGEPIGE